MTESGQLQHELLTSLKNLASELGRTPSRDEFVAQFRNGRDSLTRIFGNYSTMLQAAGLDPVRGMSKKVAYTNEYVYGRNVEESVESHIPRIVSSTSADFRPILVIGDTHFPFAHKKTLESVYRFAEKEQPAYVVQIGDLMDQWSHNRFPSSRNYYRPNEEMELARNMSVEFWLEIKKACPNAECYQLTGNHDVRALKQVLAAAPSLESLVSQSIEKLYEFEGVKTVKDYREELIIQEVMIHHGYMTRHGQQRDFVMQNLCTGHTHRGAVVYRALKDRTLWHLDVGFCGDAEAKALSYTPQKTTGWTLGWGFIDRYGPRFIPI